MADRSCRDCKWRSGHAATCGECIDANRNHPLFEAGDPVTVESLSRDVVDKWRAWGIAGVDGYNWYRLEAALMALEAELARNGP